jgi:hypothetical protein
MRKQLTEKEIEEIRELQRKGYSDSEISKRLRLLYSTVHNQREEVRERMREYMKAHRQKLDLDFQNFLELIRGFEERKNKFYLLFHLPFKTPREKLEDFSPNIYVEILRYLCESKYPQKHKNIIEAIGKDSDFQKLHWKLKGLEN